MYTRRDSLELISILIGGLVSDHSYIAGTSLASLAHDRGMTFGSELHLANNGLMGGSFGDKMCRSLILNECSTITPGIEMKWDRVESEYKKVNFEACDIIANFARSSNLSMRGHNIVWPMQKRLPRWISDIDFGRDSKIAELLLISRVDSVVSRYHDIIRSYDVINEAVDPATSLLRETTLSKAIGGAEILLDRAFQITHDRQNSAELVYNDFMSWDENGERHRTGVLNLLEGFKHRKIPVTALGIQSHLWAFGDKDSPPSQRQVEVWRRFLSNVVQLGYNIVITELDINDHRKLKSASSLDIASANYVESYLDVTLDFKEVYAMSAWGLVDKYSYLQWESPKGNGDEQRPCAYNDSYQPKPMKDAIARALKNAPHRSPQVFNSIER